ncbi:hypothetical protein [Ancylobacter sp. SL191]|uniref:hypothetical protein n=1 Tax=Ancylobacter sp. SL191 TaxID=2995166 RepID=UPI00226FBB5F|nr:hypothetical protein [Ancylobacter sp. SL191]WAC27155.1 hypothetical protein OU996_19500 [Ancylobacter sp. SL191]
MNTANLQMEGLLLAVAAVLDLLKAKGLASQAELVDALAGAERGIGTSPAGLSDSNEEAIRFPIRFLRAALQREDAPLAFMALAGEVGRQPRPTSEACASGVCPEAG